MSNEKHEDGFESDDSLGGVRVICSSGGFMLRVIPRLIVFSVGLFVIGRAGIASLE